MISVFRVLEHLDCLAGEEGGNHGSTEIWTNGEACKIIEIMEGKRPYKRGWPSGTGELTKWPSNWWEICFLQDGT